MRVGFVFRQLCELHAIIANDVNQVAPSVERRSRFLGLIGQPWALLHGSTGARANVDYRVLKRLTILNPSAERSKPAQCNRMTPERTRSCWNL